MTDTTQTGADTGAAAPAAIEIPTHIAGGEGPLSARDAARSVIDWRRKQNSETQPERTDAPAAQESEAAQAVEDAAPVEGQPSGETQEAETADTQPAIEPPRSWTKAEKDRWASLPRETQEYLSTREQEREREFRRSQNEAAETRKAIEAERTAVGQARQQYEAALPAILQTLYQEQAGAFADIRSIADVQKLAAEDPFRFSQWQAQQMKVAAIQQEMKQANDRRSEEQRTDWSKFTAREDELFLEKAPEMADPAGAAKMQSAAIDMLKDIGFTPEELAKAWNGDKLSLRDHRLQLLIRDGVRYREAQQKAKAAIAKPVPQVQRPGAAQGVNAAREAGIQALETRLSQSGSVKDAAKLLIARRAARR